MKAFPHKCDSHTQNKKVDFYSPRDHGRIGQLRDGKIFLSLLFLLWQNDVVSQESQTLFCPSEEMFEFFFLSLIWRCCPSAKWCCPSGKSIEFFFSHSNFVLRSRKKTQWTFLQDNIILLQDNIFILRSWKKTSNISSSGQKRVWLSFETTSFCRRRKKLTKKSCIPRFPNPPMISWGIKVPFPIFRVGLTFLRERRLIFTARSPSKLHFFFSGAFLENSLSKQNFPSPHMLAVYFLHSEMILQMLIKNCRVA